MAKAWARRHARCTSCRSTTADTSTTTCTRSSDHSVSLQHVVGLGRVQNSALLGVFDELRDLVRQQHPRPAHDGTQVCRRTIAKALDQYPAGQIAKALLGAHLEGRELRFMSPLGLDQGCNLLFRPPLGLGQGGQGRLEAGLSLFQPILPRFESYLSFLDARQALLGAALNLAQRGQPLLGPLLGRGQLADLVRQVANQVGQGQQLLAQHQAAQVGAPLRVLGEQPHEVVKIVRREGHLPFAPPSSGIVPRPCVRYTRGSHPA